MMAVKRFILVVLTAMLSFGGCVGLGYVWFEVLGLRGHWAQWGLGALMGLWIFAGLAVFLRVAGVPARRGAQPLPQIRLARRRQKAASLEFKRRLQKRIAELRADPLLHKYIPRLEKGELLTDDQIAYLEDTSLRATCEHLQPIEGAMRDRGVVTERLGWATMAPSIRANCVVDWDSVVACLSPDEAIRYIENFDPRDGPDANLYCETCGCHIWTVYPDEAGAEVPRFPE